MPIITILEIVMTIIFRNIIVGEKILKYSLIFLPISVVVMWFNECILKYLNNMALVVIVSLISFVLYKLTKGDLIETILQVVAATTVMLLGELIGLSISTTLNVSNQWIILFFTIIMWIILGYGISKLKLNSRFKEVFKINNSKIVINILLNSILLFFVFKSLNDKGMLNNDSVIEMSIYIVLFLGLTFNLFITISNELREKNRLQIENDFKPIFDEYIHKLRANEHEYKNHLNAIYSIINVSEDKDIKKNINEYIGKIKDNNNLNNLLYIDNTTLKAIIYSKMAVAEEKGIEINCDIKSNLSNIKLDQMDLVIVLSNLLNNAIEAVEVLENPWISVKTSERAVGNKSIYEIEVSNKINNKIEALNAINKGITTKGSNRGYGLYNIKKIVGKNNGKYTIDMLEKEVKIKIEI